MPDSKDRNLRTLRVVGEKKLSGDDTLKSATGPGLSYIDARRRKGDAAKIYDTLIQELYEEGCVKSARYFRCLVDKESELHSNESIRDQVKSDMDLLIALFENCLNAEKAALLQNCGGLMTSYRLLYQIIVLLEENSNKFEWLLERVYGIIVRIVDKSSKRIVTNRPTEMEARIYLKYGIYLGNLGDNLKTAIAYLQKTMELCRSQLWFEDSSMYATASINIKHRPRRTLSEVAAYYLAKKTLSYAKYVSRHSPQQAAKLAQKAMRTVAEVGVETNKRVFCATCIASATFLKESKLYTKALKTLAAFEHFLPIADVGEDEKLLMMKCELLIIRGSCHSNLNQMREAKAEHQRAIKIAKTNGFQYHEAESQLSAGKFFIKNKQPLQAKYAFQAAKKLFVKEHDKKSAKKTLYLLAKLQADELFPFFLDLMKDDTRCGIYKLRQWKNRCKPFWTSMDEHLKQEKVDDIYCLLTKTDESVTHRDTFQGPQHSLTNIFKHRNSKFLVLEDRFL